MNQFGEFVPLGFSAVEAGIDRVARKLNMPGELRQDVILMRLVTCMARHYEELIGRVIRPQRLNPVMFKTLLMTFGSPANEVNPSRLSDVTGESRANMTRICDELCERGLIVRKASESDRRRVVVSLTAAGERLVRKMLPRIGKPLQAAHALPGAQEKREIERLLKKQLAGLESVLDEGTSR